MARSPPLVRPRARSRAFSRVRSIAERLSVLATPISAISTETASRATTIQSMVSMIAENTARIGAPPVIWPGSTPALSATSRERSCSPFTGMSSAVATSRRGAVAPSGPSSPAGLSEFQPMACASAVVMNTSESMPAAPTLVKVLVSDPTCTVVSSSIQLGTTTVPSSPRSSFPSPGRLEMTSRRPSASTA